MCLFFVVSSLASSSFGVGIMGTSFCDVLNSRETPSLEMTILRNKELVFGYVVEGIPNGFFRVSYEYALLRFGFELIKLKTFLRQVELCR